MSYSDVTVVADIKGLDELEEAFTAGSKRAVQKFLRRIEMEAASILVESAEDNAPYAEGDLAGDIHRQTVMGDGTITVRVGPSRATFWGYILEFGSPTQPALHWLENSAKAVQDDVLAQFYQGLTEGLAAMKGGK